MGDGDRRIQLISLKQKKFRGKKKIPSPLTFLVQRFGGVFCLFFKSVFQKYF